MKYRPLRDELRAFQEGLMTPSSTGLSVAFLTLVMVSIWVLWLGQHTIMPGLQEGRRGLLPGVLEPVLCIQDFRRSSLLPRPVMVILGTSATRRVAADERKIEDAIRAAGGGDVAVRCLAVQGMTPWEQMAVLDYVGTLNTGTVVLGVNPAQLSAGRREMKKILLREPKLGFRSRVIDDEARRLGFSVDPTTGLYAVDNWRYVVPRVAGWCQRLVVPRSIFGWKTGGDDDSNVGKEKLHTRTAANLEKAGRFDTNQVLRTLDMYARQLWEEGRGKAWNVVFLEEPCNPVFITGTLGEEKYRAYLDMVSRFAREHNAAFWSWSGEVPLEGEQFWDWCHLLRDAGGVELYVKFLAERQSRGTRAAMGGVGP